MPELGLGLLWFVGQPIKRGKSELQLRDGRRRPLETEPSKPADHSRLVAGRISTEQRADPERVVQVDRRKLGGSAPNERQVAGLECLAEARIGSTLDRHEPMF